MLKNLYVWCDNQPPSSVLQAKIYSWIKILRLLLCYKTTAIGFAIILALLLLAAFAPLLAPYLPDQPQLAARLQPVSMQHWCGTDELGRDIFSRIVFGSRYALYVVAMVTIMVVPIGLLVGAFAGYAGGFVDKILMRTIDVFLAFPKLILALAFVAALGPGINNAICAIVLTSWAPYARQVRAKTIAIINSEFIWALKLQGASRLRLLVKHILPLSFHTIIIQASLDMSGFILSVAGLGFLGVGAQPPTPEWGAMIATGREYILEQWWLITFPGMAIAIVSIGFNLLGDGLRDLFDPRHGTQA